MHHRFLATLAGTLMLGFVGTTSAQSATKATDSNFMVQAAADGMAEINMGRLALEKSSDSQVRQLAQRIVIDHTEANKKLRALALKRHVRLPAEPTAEATQKAVAMKKMEGENFDRAWAEAMIKDHLKAIDLFATASQQAEDMAVRKFAEDTAPALQTHLQMAQKLTGMPTTDAAGTTPGLGRIDECRSQPALCPPRLPLQRAGGRGLLQRALPQTGGITDIRPA